MIAEGASIGSAASAIGISRRQMYAWRETDSQFSEDWASALDARVEGLEAEAVKRAMGGSDRLLQFLLASYAPERFSERSRLELTGPGGAPLLHLSDAELSSKLSMLLLNAGIDEPSTPAIEDADWHHVEDDSGGDLV